MSLGPVSYAGQEFPTHAALARHLASTFGKRFETVQTLLSRHKGDVECVARLVAAIRNQPPRRIWTEDRIQQLRALWAEGLSMSAIGQRLGVSKNTIIGKVHRLRLPGRPSPTLWTEERLEQLRALWAEGLSQSAIEQRLGVGNFTAGRKARQLGLPPRPAMKRVGAGQLRAEIHAQRLAEAATG